MEYCQRCQNGVETSQDFCLFCGNFLGYPNVREAKKTSEVSAVNQKYSDALSDAKRRGISQILQDFDSDLKNSHAVINVNFQYLYDFINDDNTLYANYHVLVKGKARRPAKEEFDRQRSGVDALLFGSYADKINFAVLSLDGLGLKSYGDFAMKLYERAIQDRATVLETNSFQFVEQHNLTPEKTIPTGCRTTWENRNKLAVCKRIDKIKQTTQKKEFPKILLQNTGDRKKDEFIEVHIFGSFNNKAIESVKGSSTLKNHNFKALLEELKEHLVDIGKVWEEE